MTHDAKSMMLERRADTDQMLTELLAVAAQRSKAQLLRFQKRLEHERYLNDYMIKDLERRATQAESLAAIRAMTIDAWRGIAQQHEAKVADFEAPGPTH